MARASLALRYLQNPIVDDNRIVERTQFERNRRLDADVTFDVELIRIDALIAALIEKTPRYLRIEIDSSLRRGYVFDEELRHRHIDFAV